MEENNFEFNIHHITVYTELFHRKVFYVRDLSLLSFTLHRTVLLFDFYGLISNVCIKIITQFYLHVIRMNIERMPKIMLNYRPNG